MSVSQYKKEVAMMNLEALIQDRETISKKTFPISDNELLSRFERLYTGAVNDVLREFCLLNQALPGYILPLREYRTVAGFAFTVKSAPNVLSGVRWISGRRCWMKWVKIISWYGIPVRMQKQLVGGVMTATAKGKIKAAAWADGESGYASDTGSGISCIL